MRFARLFVRRMVCAFCVVGFALVLSLGCGTTTHGPKDTFGTSFTPPALNAMDPNTVPVNSTPFVMTLNGHNFGPDAIVFWNSVPHMARFLSPTQLQVSITADDLKMIAKSKGMQVLNLLRAKNMTDDWLKLLAGAEHMEAILLDGDGITDAGMSHCIRSRLSPRDLPLPWRTDSRSE